MITVSLGTPATGIEPVPAISRWERLTLASGIVAAALVFLATALFLAFVVPTMPPVDAPASQAAAFYVAQSDRLVYRLVSYLGEAQMVFLMLFFGGLYGMLHHAEGSAGSLASAVFSAGSAIAIITPLAIMLEDHLLLGAAAAGVDPLVVRTFDGAGPLSFALSGFAQIVVLGGTPAVLMSHRLLPRWLSWFSALVGVLSLIGTGTLVAAALFPLAVLAMLLFRVWIVALSIALLQRHKPDVKVHSLVGSISPG